MCNINLMAYISSDKKPIGNSGNYKAHKMFLRLTGKLFIVDYKYLER